MTPEPSDALVFFGATGDLAYKQIFPALQALVRRGHLDMPIIGVAKAGWNLDPLVEASWDRKHIESVQITMAENFGVAGRGKFYEEAGAIRDVVQNHMLEVIACLGMDCPCAKDHETQRNERGKLLQAVRTLKPEDVVRGQFQGYRAEPGVAPDSSVETFAALRFYIDNDRWQGVPFYVRVGKLLPVTAAEVLVQLKRPDRPVLEETGPTPANFNSLRRFMDDTSCTGRVLARCR